MNRLTDVAELTCCGCRACVESCPKKCISVVDALQSSFVSIDKDKCVECGLCIRVCPIISHTHSVNDIIEAEAGIHKSENEICASSSGGAFWALCQELVPQGYVVAGVNWNSHHKAETSIARTLTECERFRKSKYVYAGTNGIFGKVKDILKHGGKVVFTGLPCQVSACKNVVGEHPNLLLVDLICHGAPTQTILDKEIEYLQNKNGAIVSSIEFKSKVKLYGHFNSRSCRVSFTNGKNIILTSDNDPFMRGYYSRLFYRESCGKCPFASPKRSGDITIGDAWGIENIHPELNPLHGVSLILFNTLKGLLFKDVLCKNMHIWSVDVDWSIEANEQLRKPTSFHQGRSRFFELIGRCRFDKAVFTVCDLPWQRKLRILLKKIYFNCCKIT